MSVLVIYLIGNLVEFLIFRDTYELKRTAFSVVFITVFSFVFGLAYIYIDLKWLMVVLILIKIILKLINRRKNMKTVDKLLKIDAGEIKKNEDVIELYLSRLKDTFEFPIIEVDPEYVAELQEESLELNLDGDVKIKTFNQKMLTIIEGCPMIFKNTEIQKHFRCQTPKDLVKKILTSGDMDELFNKIQELNGYDKKKDREEVKN